LTDDEADRGFPGSDYNERRAAREEAAGGTDGVEPWPGSGFREPRPAHADSETLWAGITTAAHAGAAPPANLVGTAFGLLGAAGLAVAAFLPYADTSGRFDSVAQNTLVQEGTGIFFLIEAAVIAAVSLIAVRKFARRWLNLGIAAALYGIYHAAMFFIYDDNLTLYPIDDSGNVIPGSDGTTVGAGIGVILGLAAAIAAAVGLILLRVARRKSVQAQGVAVAEPLARLPEAQPPAGEDRLARLERLVRLRDSGALTSEEFEVEKQRALESTT
jgi:hypothetical protein